MIDLTCQLTRTSRFPPLAQHRDFAIVPAERIRSLTTIGISSPHFEISNLGAYRDLTTVIFLARRDLPSRDHPRTIRPLDSDSDGDGEGDEVRYYETLNEVGDDSLVAVAERECQTMDAF